MATDKKVLSLYDKESLPNVEGSSVGIVVAEWHSEITEVLLKGAVDTLMKNGIDEEDIIIKHVPGTFELTLAAKYMINYTDVEAVIAIGCVIRGETTHFDFVCQSVTQGLTNLTNEYFIPLSFCVLTTDTMEQAKERAGGKHGNKGVEAAIAAIKMIHLHDEMYEDYDDDGNFLDELAELMDFDDDDEDIDIDIDDEFDEDDD